MTKDKKIYMYGEMTHKAPLVIVNTFGENGSELYTELQRCTDKEYCLAVISDIDWNNELSPWEYPAIYKNDSPFGGGADDYVAALEDILVPQIREKLAFESEYTVIAGYSLAGLFSIYSLYKTDIFSRAVSASGSMWFPGFAEYASKEQLIRKPDKVYFSLGDKEAATRNSLLKTVKEKTTEIYNLFGGAGIDTVFEMNPGNHFKDADKRLAKGIAWVLS